MARRTYVPPPQKRSGCGCIVPLLLCIAMVFALFFIAPQIERYRTPLPQPHWYVDLQHKIGKVTLPSLPAAYAAAVDPAKLVATALAHVKTHTTALSTSTGDMSLYGPPTLTGAQIDTILTEHHSPAAGIGQDIYNLGVLYGIDPTFALAFFQHESSWGLAGMAQVTHSPGNLRCLPGIACYQGYASFSNWTAGFQHWYALLAGPVYKGSGLTTVAQIIPKYAPHSDHNDDAAYIVAVLTTVQQFRNEVHA